MPDDDLSHEDTVASDLFTPRQLADYQAKQEASERSRQAQKQRRRKLSAAATAGLGCVLVLALAGGVWGVYHTPARHFLPHVSVPGIRDDPAPVSHHRHRHVQQPAAPQPVLAPVPAVSAAAVPGSGILSPPAQLQLICAGISVCVGVGVVLGCVCLGNAKKRHPQPRRTAGGAVFRGL